jgi:hypothetical protein
LANVQPQSPEENERLGELLKKWNESKEVNYYHLPVETLSLGDIPRYPVD